MNKLIKMMIYFKKYRIKQMKNNQIIKKKDKE